MKGGYFLAFVLLFIGIALAAVGYTGYGHGVWEAIFPKASPTAPGLPVSSKKKKTV